MSGRLALHRGGGGQDQLPYLALPESLAQQVQPELVGAAHRLDQSVMTAVLVHQPALNPRVRQAMLLVLTVDRQ